MPSADLDWRDLFVLVTNAQPDTAVFKAMVPDWQHTPELELLRSAEFCLRMNVWFQTTDAPRNRNRPEPYPLPWDPKPARDDAFEADVLPRHELDRIIGWA